MAIRQATLLIRDRQVTGGALPADALMAEPFVNLFDGVLRFSGVTGGGFEPSSVSSVFEVGSTLYNSKITNRLNINDNFIISGDTGLISTYNGSSGAGLDGTFLSGTTNGFVLGNISDIQGVTDITRVQPGTNITTGGTDNEPTVNLVDSPSVNNITFSGTATGGDIIADSLSATTVSGGTIYSGSTDVEDVIYSIVNGTELNDITRVQPGTNTTTGGTDNFPTVNVVDSPSFNNITFSGTATGGDIIADSLSATTVSGGTIYSGSTDLYSIFLTSGDLSGTSVSAGSNISVNQVGNDYEVSVVDSPSFNSITFSGTANGGSVNVDDIIATAVTINNGNFNITGGGVIQSGSTDLYNIFVTSDTNDITRVQPGTNISTGGTDNFPTVNVVDSPTFAGLVSATGFTDSSLTAGRVVYVGTAGRLVDEAGFEYDDVNNLLYAPTLQVGTNGDTGTTLTVYGDIIALGEAISGFTSELYIEDNLIELNYNPTASTESTSLGAGFSVQDGSGSAGTDAFWDIRGTGVGVANRGFATNLNDIYIREDGTTGSPGGVRVIAEQDVIDGGSY
jgi:hypothetical protein